MWRARIKNLMHTAPAKIEPPPQAALLQNIMGDVIARAVYVAAKLGIADLLKDGPRTTGELVIAAGVWVSSRRATTSGSS
jgi:hypothetical protein